MMNFFLNLLFFSIVIQIPFFKKILHNKTNLYLIGGGFYSNSLFKKIKRSFCKYLI